jgi:hypothetical protein
MTRGSFHEMSGWPPQEAAGGGEGIHLAARRAEHERRNLPMVEIDKEYIFRGPGGQAGLPGLFGTAASC